jgi:predicted transcriptional regulator
VSVAPTATPVNRAAASSPRTESQLQPAELSPLERAAPSVREVLGQVLEWHRLTPPNRHRGHRGSPVALLCYATERDLDTAQAFLRQGFCTRDAATAIHGTLKARFEQGAVPDAPLQPVGEVFGDPYTWSDRRQKRGRYCTWKRCRLLAAVQEYPRGRVTDLAMRAGMSPRRAGEALGVMLLLGQVLLEKEGRQHQWSLTKKGIAAIEKARQRLAGTFTSCCEARPEGPEERTRLSLLFEAAQTVSRELRELRWYPDAIREVLKQHNVTYVLGLLRNDRLRSVARNLGALLYAILLKPEAILGNRIRGLARTLAGVSQAVRGAFSAVAAQWKMGFNQARRLVCSLRKVHRKRGGLTVGDVHGIAGWIMKRLAPVPLQLRP